MKNAPAIGLAVLMAAGLSTPALAQTANQVAAESYDRDVQDYQAQRATKNKMEADINARFQDKTKGLKDWQILQQSFNKMK